MGYPVRVLRSLPSALRRLPAFLQASDARLDVVNRTLKSPLAFPIAFSSQTCWTYTSGERLVLGAVGPAWRGLRKICKNADTAELVDNFMHFASQYVIRSRIVRIQAGFALTFSATADFRDADIRRITVGPGSPYPNLEAAHQAFRRDLPMPTVRPSRRSREFTAWVEMLNPLEPFIHRALFQFWRSCALANVGFWEDAVSALDGVTAVAGEAAQRWHLLRGQPTRRGTGALFGLRVEDQTQLEALYQLRCAFGAHPPPSKWWDFAELYDSEIDEFRSVSRRLIRNLCSHELASRRVEPNPSNWSDWFVKNADLLLKLVWFTMLPNLPR
jgi:hypothetical protein